MESSENQENTNSKRPLVSRRNFLLGAVGLGGIALAGGYLGGFRWLREKKAEVFIHKAADYQADFRSIILAGLRELGVIHTEIKGKSILLKPNMVEPIRGAQHITTHPHVVRGAIEAFLGLGASRVIVAEGPGHCTDFYRVIYDSGMTEVCREDHIPMVDLNNDSIAIVPNVGRKTELKSLAIPKSVLAADWIVSMPKMKTHHWVGVTLSMKNMFGILPGGVYGWPKNVLHQVGIVPSILDVNSTIKPHFAIIDGVVGMEGDGPIMGDPHQSGVIVMGRNPAATDATSARIMGIDPDKIDYLYCSSGWLGTIAKINIAQRGEEIATVISTVKLIDKISAQSRIRL